MSRYRLLTQQCHRDIGVCMGMYGVYSYSNYNGRNIGHSITALAVHVIAITGYTISPQIIERYFNPGI